MQGVLQEVAMPRPAYDVACFQPWLDTWFLRHTWPSEVESMLPVHWSKKHARIRKAHF